MKKIISTVRKIEMFLAGVVFISSLVVLSLNIGLRQINHSFEWAEEYMRYAIIWVTFIGCAICAEDDAHVGIDIVFQLSPPRVRKILKSISMACATLFCVFFLNFSARNTMLLRETMQRSPVMLLPMWYIYLSMPIGALFSAFQYGLKTYTCLRSKEDYFITKAKKDEDIDILDLN
jgi:C4-dicarboxylate transporter DctQ subunit